MFVCDDPYFCIPGDLVTAWNNQDLTKMSYEEVLKLISSQPGMGMYSRRCKVSVFSVVGTNCGHCFENDTLLLVDKC